jgi:nicotinate-nucleotide pyrophosphorylase (carboxylating)
MMKNYYKDFNFTQAKKLIEQALREDKGTGDATSNLLIDKKKIYHAELLLKEDAVIAGFKIFEMVFDIVDSGVKIKKHIDEGKFYKKGTIAAEIKGNARSMLLAERLSLNLIQRMSGIATKTYKMRKLLNNDSIKLIDTRKTTPNLRLFEKLAVKIGGGANHRFGLYDMILIKDNHIESNGGILNTLEKLKKIKTVLKKEIEIKDLNEFQIVQIHGKDIIDIVMLDNFKLQDVKRAAEMNKRKFRIEISGGVNESNIAQYGKIKGIDFISSGALTHSVKSVDLSLNFIS